MQGQSPKAYDFPIDEMFARLFHEHPLVDMAWVDYMTSWDARKAPLTRLKEPMDEEFVGIGATSLAVQALVNKYIFPSPEELNGLFAFLVDILAWANSRKDRCFHSSDSRPGMTPKDRAQFPTIFDPAKAGKFFGDLSVALQKATGSQHTPGISSYAGLEKFKGDIAAHLVTDTNTSLYNARAAKQMLGEPGFWLSDRAGIIAILHSEVRALFQWFETAGKPEVLQASWEKETGAFDFPHRSWFENDTTAPEHFLRGTDTNGHLRMKGTMLNLKEDTTWFTNENIRTYVKSGRKAYLIEFALSGYNYAKYMGVAVQALGKLKEEGTLQTKSPSSFEVIMLDPGAVGLEQWPIIGGAWLPGEKLPPAAVRFINAKYSAVPEVSRVERLETERAQQWETYQTEYAGRKRPGKRPRPTLPEEAAFGTEGQLHPTPGAEGSGRQTAWGMGGSPPHVIRKKRAFGRGEFPHSWPYPQLTEEQYQDVVADLSGVGLGAEKKEESQYWVWAAALAAVVFLGLQY